MIGGGESDLLAVTFRASPSARLRLFCLPYAGGGASAFARWHRSLPSDVEVVPIQLPGRESSLSERTISDMDVVLSKLERLLESKSDKPFVLFGHSLGALLAFEAARRLMARGSAMPMALIVSGKRAPAMPSRSRPIWDLRDDEFIEEIRRFNGTPEGVLTHRELLPLILPALRADTALFDRYEYRKAPRLSCPIVAFGGDRDPYVNLEELNGWAEETEAGFESRVFEGDHFFIHAKEREVLEELARRLGTLTAGLGRRHSRTKPVERWTQSASGENVLERAE